MEFEYFPCPDGQWRWHLRAGNNRYVACSGEGYCNLQDCLHAIELVRNSFYAPISLRRIG